MELKFYRVLKADPLGDPWTPSAANAKPLQTFWCQFEGVDKPVQMAKQIPNTPSLTYGQFGYLIPAKSQKGTDYFKFKSQQAPPEMEQPRYDATDGAVATSSTPSPTQPHPSAQVDIPLWFAPFGIMIRGLHEDLIGRAQRGVDEHPPTEDRPLTQTEVLEEAKQLDDEPPTVEGIGGGTITQDELENIFGGKMAAPVDLTKE